MRTRPHGEQASLTEHPRGLRCSVPIGEPPSDRLAGRMDARVLIPGPHTISKAGSGVPKRSASPVGGRSTDGACCLCLSGQQRQISSHEISGRTPMANHAALDLGARVCNGVQVQAAWTFTQAAVHSIDDVN